MMVVVNHPSLSGLSCVRVVSGGILRVEFSEEFPMKFRAIFGEAFPHTPCKTLVFDASNKFQKYDPY